MQISMFDGDKPFKVDKPLRLITLFSGYDSQALALKYLGVPFEHYKTCEWAIPSIQALKDLHFENDDTDYSVGMSKAQLVETLYKSGVSADYNIPLTKEQLQRYGESKLRTIYNNICACHNLVSICNAKGEDLGIKETNKYCYLLTYSFPCQDLSAAGLGKGMERGSGTRSGMLWEVERLLKETKELPQVLLMENVKQVIGQKNIKAFAEWIAFLDELGYHSKWQVINATDFSIPQNRERCFMVSVLGNHYYEFPKVIGNKLQLKDVLEKNIAERYYLSEKIVENFYKRNILNAQKGNGFRFEPTEGENIANSVLTRNGSRPCDNYIIQRSHGFNKGGKKNLCPAITTSAFEQNNLIVEEKGYRFYNQALKTIKDNDCKVGDIVDAFNKKINDSGISPTITTRPEGFKTAILVVDEPKQQKEIIVFDDYNNCVKADQSSVGTLTRNCGNDAIRNGVKIIEKEECDYRVRKLTERECGRLMGVKDDDISKIGKNLSRSAQYHTFGDSIVTACLMAIFGKMLNVNYESKIKELTKKITGEG